MKGAYFWGMIWRVGEKIVSLQTIKIWNYEESIRIIVDVRRGGRVRADEVRARRGERCAVCEGTCA